MVFDPGFENAGTYAGDADGWTTSTTDSLWGWAYFGTKEWGIERFETDWDNDDYIWSFSVSDLESATFDPLDNKLYEAFLYWPTTLLTYIADWTEVSDDPATFDTTVPQDFEDFEEEWGNWPWYPAFASFILGEAVENFTIGSTNNKFRIKLEDGSTFDEALEATAGTYTASALAAHLQTLVNTALTAEGAPFAANDILFYESDYYAGQIIVKNNKTGYKITIYAGAEDGWPQILGRSIAWNDFRYYESDLLDPSVHAWTGEYYNFDFKVEQFERDWGNSDLKQTQGAWEYNFQLVGWIDGTTILETTTTISVGVNDTFFMRIRKWGTTDNTNSGTLTIPPGGYSKSALVTQIQSLIDAWLTAAPSPFASGDITVSLAPNGSLRFENTGQADFVMSLASTAKKFWDYIGIEYDQAVDIEYYPHPVSARWRETDAWNFATFDSGANEYENFEDASWPAL